MKLLTPPNGNTKTNKSLALGYATYILHFTPTKKSGKNVCSMSTPGCEASCLDESGRGNWTYDKNGNMNPIHKARLNRTNFFFNDRSAFLKQLTKEIKSAIKAAQRKGLKATFRLNGTSDIRWENYGIIQNFSDHVFYDYTKIYNRKNIPSNYHLTFSRAESNHKETLSALVNGLNVAAVFRNELPKTFLNKKVINGDKHDLRFLDPKHCIVGLIAKGKAKKDTSGFVIG